VASGERNTKFFHAYANSRKQNNTIWNITKEDGTVITSNLELQKEGVDYFQNISNAHDNQLALLGNYLRIVDYFQNIFNAEDNLSISHQLAVLGNYLRMFSVEEGLRLAEPVTLAEILSTLKGFNVSKIPRLDGWDVEFFLTFFSLLGNDILEMVEESMRKGSLECYLLSLIPKSDDSFGGFRPIALCNLVYNIITKIIAARIKSSLSVGISKEQFGFLEGKQITDAIGVVHEALHSIKVKNIKALVLKLDLIKAYDRVD
jgi:hypothetical protein